MSIGEFSKAAIATILGILVVHIWSIGEHELAIMILASMIFHIFFVVGEKKEEKMEITGKPMVDWEEIKIIGNKFDKK